MNATDPSCRCAIAAAIKFPAELRLLSNRASASTTDKLNIARNVSQYGRPDKRKRLAGFLTARLARRQLLGTWTIAPDGSVLPLLALRRLAALRTTYLDVAKTGFRRDLGSTPNLASPTGSHRTLFGSVDLIERAEKSIKGALASPAKVNLSLFMSRALQLYRSASVSDQRPYGRFANGDASAFPEQQEKGLTISRNEGECINCQGSAEFTNTSVRKVMTQHLEQVAMGDRANTVHDDGFHNIGARPAREDLGGGRPDKLGNALSKTRMVQPDKAHLADSNLGASRNPWVDATACGHRRWCLRGPMSQSQATTRPGGLPAIADRCTRAVRARTF